MHGHWQGSLHHCPQQQQAGVGCPWPQSTRLSDNPQKLKAACATCEQNSLAGALSSAVRAPLPFHQLRLLALGMWDKDGGGEGGSKWPKPDSSTGTPRDQTTSAFTGPHSTPEGKQEAQWGEGADQSSKAQGVALGNPQ